MLFDSWQGILRTAIVGVLAYAILVAALRTSGKRTLSKMHAFDLVATVALGSTLATILLSDEVALSEGVAAFAVLIALQFLVAQGAVSSRWVRRAVSSTPRALLVDGELQEAALQEERVTREEVLAAVRANGIGALHSVAAVVLEANGSFSVIPAAEVGDRSALATVRGA